MGGDAGNLESLLKPRFFACGCPKTFLTKGKLTETQMSEYGQCTAI